MNTKLEQVQSDARLRAKQAGRQGRRPGRPCRKIVLDTFRSNRYDVFRGTDQRTKGVAAMRYLAKLKIDDVVFKGKLADSDHEAVDNVLAATESVVHRVPASDIDVLVYHVYEWMSEPPTLAYASSLSAYLAAVN